MKTSLILALAPVSLALVGFTASMSGKPQGGLQDMTLGFRMNSAEYKAGYYYAHQFYFTGKGGLGYTGLQPEPLNKLGQSIVHGVFSSFINGSTTDHPNCHAGADGGPGVSCKVEVPGSYGDQYDFVVKRADDNIWAGTMVNARTGNGTEIGSWTVPPGMGGLQSGTLGFVEYYVWNSGKPIMCGDLPFTDITVVNPRSSTPGAGTGKVDKPFGYGDCNKEVDFATAPTQEGQRVRVGFGPNAPAPGVLVTNNQTSIAATESATSVSSQPSSAATQPTTLLAGVGAQSTTLSSSVVPATTASVSHDHKQTSNGRHGSWPKGNHKGMRCRLE